jgi:thioredoxin-like negative regulator of GroEL
MTFDQLLQADYKFPTVAIFYGHACAPCERLKPVLREVCRDAGVRLEEFNSANEMDAIRSLGLRTVPGVYVVHKGVAKLAFTGFLPHVAVRQKLDAQGVEIF